MEKDLKEIANEALNNPKVCGYLCCDENGLCLTGSGDVNERSSGLLNAIAQLANKLDSNNSPVICIDSDKRKILIKSKDSITTAIYKTT